MKLILQIALGTSLGVFIGVLGAQLLLDAWRSHQAALVTERENQQRAEQARAYEQQARQLQDLLRSQISKRARSLGNQDNPGSNETGLPPDEGMPAPNAPAQ
jgi:hypothetical protein